ncbi:hypothetical protein GWK47_039007 [Chionoecetes opilio]|uniref:Uncharacterized protein n=1 Tax=Chionoecetes opilio TaxID=41210 RepID=A0A8J4YKH5_CHIOP|nr:hypothetical protein GWK47_039007 [Chionoecetes opilio]
MPIKITACTVILRRRYDGTLPPKKKALQRFQHVGHATEDKSPQFLYWDTSLENGMLSLAFVRSLRTGNFDLYKNTIRDTWFFQPNHTHKPVFGCQFTLRVCSLDITHPVLLKNFVMEVCPGAKIPANISPTLLIMATSKKNRVLKEKEDLGDTGCRRSFTRAVSGPNFSGTSEFGILVGKKESAAKKTTMSKRAPRSIR